MRARVEEFLRNPILHIVVTFSLVFALVTITDRIWQIIGVSLIAIVVCASSLLYYIYKERISAERLRDEVKKLKVFEDEVKKLKVLDKQIPRLIKYKRIEKRITIKNDNGDAKFSIFFSGENMTNRPLTKICHGMITVEKVDNMRASVNREPITPTFNSVSHDKKFVTNIVFPIRKAIPARGPVEYEHETNLKGEYKKGFGAGRSSSNHKFYFPTDLFYLQIKAPPGFIFHPNPETKVRDIFFDIEALEEEDRIRNENLPELDQNSRVITWEVKFPKISYLYIISFKLRRLKKGR